MALILGVLLGCAEPPCGPGEVCTVIGAGQTGWNGEGGSALDAWLYLPTALTLAPDGRPCVVDFNNMRVRCLDDGRLVTVAGSGEHAYSVPGAALRDSPLENPMDAQWSPDGRLTILAVHENRLVADDGTGHLEVLAGTGEEGYGGDGGPAIDADLAQPCGFTWAGDGSLWIADTLNGVVRRIDDAGVITTVLPDLPGVQRVRPGLGDEVLVTDTFGGRVLAAGPDGQTRVLVEGLAYPWSARLGPDGLLYALSSATHEVVRVDADGGVQTVAGTGEAGFSGDGGPATEAAFAWPSDLVFTDDGRLWIADMQNARVRVIQLP